MMEKSGRMPDDQPECLGGSQQRNQQFDEDSDIFKAESLAALIMLAFYRIDVCELQQYKDES